MPDRSRPVIDADQQQSGGDLFRKHFHQVDRFLANPAGRMASGQNDPTGIRERKLSLVREWHPTVADVHFDARPRASGHAASERDDQVRQWLLHAGGASPAEGGEFGESLRGISGRKNPYRLVHSHGCAGEMSR